MSLRFTKMHGAGNDFVMLDLRGGTQEPSTEITRLLGDRHMGVGADQIISIEDPDQDGVLARYRIWNADGSIAQQCGNGARCVAAYVDRELGPLTEFTLSSPAGLHPVTVLGNGHYRIEMGLPEFEPARIPLHGFDTPALTYQALDVEFSAVSMGNPHAVIVVDSVEGAPVADIGPLLQNSPYFPESVNVGFAQVIDRTQIKLRVYERGAGETLACGSGACAAAAALMQRDLIDRAVDVSLPGGVLRIEWPSSGEPITMSGPAAFVFTGELND